jgi:integrase
MPGFGLMVTASGHSSFVFQYRAGHKSRRITFKRGFTLQEARKEAQKLQGEIAHGRDPQAVRGGETFLDIAETYLRIEGNNLRSLDQQRGLLKRLPSLGIGPIGKVKRSDVVAVLDKISAERGLVAADQSLALIRRVMNWHAARSDDYRSPIVRGMARTRPSERARKRVLTDDELRAIWQAAEASTGIEGPFVQFLLLTGARRNEVAGMRYEEIDRGGVWVIPAARHKVGRKLGDLVRPLPPTAIAVLERLPRIEGSPYVFSHDGAHSFANFTRAKEQIDKACGVTGWTFHDLRRTARSLMSRAEIDGDIAERVLGHVIGGVRGVYDRHHYDPEKKAALLALANLIDRIVNPTDDNVVPLRAGGTG